MDNNGSSDNIYYSHENATIAELNELFSKRFDDAIIAVAHDEFKLISLNGFLNEANVVFDVECALDKNKYDEVS